MVRYKQREWGKDRAEDGDFGKDGATTTINWGEKYSFLSSSPDDLGKKGQLCYEIRSEQVYRCGGPKELRPSVCQEHICDHDFY